MKYGMCKGHNENIFPTRNNYLFLCAVPEMNHETAGNHKNNNRHVVRHVYDTLKHHRQRTRRRSVGMYEIINKIE